MSNLNKVLITGASDGFGMVIIDALIEEGYRITGALRDAEGRNKRASEELRRKGVFVIEIDVTNDESVVTGGGTAAAHMGGIDILINNAGIGTVGRNSLRQKTGKRFLM